MRRALVTTLAVPALLLSACGSDDEQGSEDSSSQQESSSQETTEEPTEAQESTQEPDDARQSTEQPADAAGSTASGRPEGGAAGKAAATRTKAFMVALVNADPKICQLIMNYEGDKPMKDSPDDLKVCKDVLPSTLEGLVTKEEANIIDLIEINGAEVNGNTAVVDSDNFSDLFAEGFAGQEITLKKVQNEWYVDLDNSFQGTTG